MNEIIWHSCIYGVAWHFIPRNRFRWENNVIIDIFYFCCRLNTKILMIKSSILNVNLSEKNLVYLTVMVMVFKVTFNNTSAISWRSVLLVEETGVPGENHRLVIIHWQPVSHNVVSSSPCHERGSNAWL